MIPVNIAAAADCARHHELQSSTETYSSQSEVPWTGLLWLPSQSGAEEDILQPQKNTFLDSVALYLTGVNSVP